MVCIKHAITFDKGPVLHIKTFHGRLTLLYMASNGVHVGYRVFIGLGCFNKGVCALQPEEG